METELREVGIPQFYETKEALLDRLVQYFKVGLENNEFCFWVTSDPLEVEDAGKAMASAVTSFDRYVQKGQIEIVPDTEWYFKDGVFYMQRVLQGWQEKHQYALARGYDGIRLTGNLNAVWLKKANWTDFYQYEQMLVRTIKKCRMLVLCSFALDQCGATEIIDVVRNHQSARIERLNSWQSIESAELKLTKAELRRLNDQLEALVDERTRQLKVTNEELQNANEKLSREHSRIRLLLDVNKAVVSTFDLNKILLALRASCCLVIQTDLCLALYDAERKQLQLDALYLAGNSASSQETTLILAENSPMDKAIKTLKVVRVKYNDFDMFPPAIGEFFIKEGIKSACCIPLVSHGRPFGVLTFASHRKEFFTTEEMDLLRLVANLIAVAVENALSYRQIEELKNKLTAEKLYLEGEIKTELNFGEIIGKSAAIKHVLKQVKIVAPTNSTILIQGETGTGKELIARAIHNLSERRDRTMVKINCGAIPSGLLESELFGHEKGAFTGAFIQKIGRFELAHQGTICLDEIGDIPIEIQTKLLRVLQEREFERLGSTRTICVDVRIIAATHRDLTQMVADKQFRSDLYYRLNVFPLKVPPLRERIEDIPLLVRHFSQKYALRMKKRIETVPKETLAALSKYLWPGNLRELENFIERSVILSPGPMLQINLAELKSPSNKSKNTIVTLEAAEREHIMKALHETNWVVAGRKGAATLLGLNRSTLRSKMRKLGISHQS